MKRDNVRVWTDGPVGRIVLNRPAVLNALDYLTVVELESAVRELTGLTRVLVIQGAGNHFCAGADLGYLAGGLSPQAIQEFIEQINRAFFSIQDAAIPVLAAVQGFALAGGFELIQACDIVIVAEDASIGDQHSNFGLIPGGGGSQRLPRLVGRQRALSLLLTGERLSGKQAVEWGLAYRAVPAERLEQDAMALAQRLVGKSSEGLKRMKHLVNKGLAGPLNEGIALEVQTFLEFIDSPDPQEGLEAFRQKRSPVFPP